MEQLRIGDRVLYEGREYVVDGVDPMSVPERRLYLRDSEDGTTRIVPLRVLTAVDPEPPSPPNAA